MGLLPLRATDEFYIYLKHLKLFVSICLFLTLLFPRFLVTCHFFSHSSCAEGVSGSELN